MSFRIGVIIIATVFVAAAAAKTSLGVTARVAARRALKASH